MIEAIYTCVPLYLMLSWERYQARLRPDAVVNGFFVFGTRTVQWVSATVTVNVLKTLLYVKQF
jgi:hypothetical protein